MPLQVPRIRDPDEPLMLKFDRSLVPHFIEPATTGRRRPSGEHNVVPISLDGEPSAGMSTDGHETQPEWTFDPVDEIEGDARDSTNIEWLIDLTGIEKAGHWFEGRPREGHIRDRVR